MKIILQLILVISMGFSLAHRADSQKQGGQSSNSRTKKSQPKILTAEQIAKKFLPSIVLITCDDGKGKFSQGSGFPVEVKATTGPPIAYWDKDGLKFIPYTEQQRKEIGLISSKEVMVLTNYHVIEGMVRGRVKVAVGGKASKEWWIDKVIYTDAKNDLALLSVKDASETLDLDSGQTNDNRLPAAFILSNLDKYELGETIYVLSNPEGLAGTISKGIVSGGIRRVKDVELLQIDAPISSGSSGGAVLNAIGDVVGIATGSFKEGQNLNFAVSASSIRSFIKNYEAVEKDLRFAASTIHNGWQQQATFQEPVRTMTGGPSVTQPAVKPERQEEPSVDHIQQELTKLLKGVEVVEETSERGVVKVTNLSFSGCKLNLSTSTKLSSGSWEDSFSMNLAKLKEIGFVKNKFGVNGVYLDLHERILMNTAWDHGGTSASMAKSVFIPTANGQIAISASDSLSVLSRKCNGFLSEPAEKKPDLKETANWLTNKIEGVTFYTGQTHNKYEQLAFADCGMTLTQVSKSGATKLVTTYPANLRMLNRVESQRDKFGDWGVMLRFSSDLNIVFERYDLYVSKSTTKEDRILIVFGNDSERAKRVGTAFERSLELCSDEIKEPF